MPLQCVKTVAMPVQLTRFCTDCKQKFTVVVFDTSANYGADYTISYGGASTEKFSGAQSIFDAFKNGGFFTTRSDENGNTYMMCGSSALNYFGTGTITQKWQQAKELNDALAYQRQTGQVAPNEGGSDVEVPAMGGTPSNNYLKIPESKNVWTVEPAYLFMITISENSSHDDYYVSSFLASFGVDAFFTRCFPFSIYGVSLYVSAYFTTELYYSLKLDFAEFQDKQESDIGTNAVKEASTKETADEGTKVDTFIAAPVMKITMKGGVGFNGFCSLYLTSSISAPFIIQFYPGGAASCPSFTVGFGADLAVFNVESDTTVNLPPVATSEQVMGDLKTILGQSTTNATSVQSASAQVTDSETATSVTDALRSALSTEEIMEQLNNATFSPIVATEGSDSGLRTLGSGKSTIDTNVFKNTGVHLLKQDGKILAFYLQDTGERILKPSTICLWPMQ